MEKQTRFFPIMQSDTVLFSDDIAPDLKTLVEPVKKTYLQENLTQDEVETCIAVHIL